MNLRDFSNAVGLIALNYPTIQEYSEGDIYNYLNTGEHKYPCVFLTIESVNEGEGDTQTVTGSLFYVDRLINDSSNRLMVQTAAVSTLKILAEKIDENISGEMEVETYQPFTEKFADWTAGAFCEFNFTYTADLDCGEYDELALTVKENGVYSILGYEKLVVAVPQSGGVTEEWVENYAYSKSEVDGKLEEKADKSEIPSLDGYATEQWVESKGYLTEHQPLKTINHQSIIGEGNIDIQGGGGSLTPEQEEVLDKLIDSKSGAFYTKEIKAHSSIRTSTESESQNNFCQIGDDFYLYKSGYIYKYDPATFSFNRLNEYHINNLQTYNKFWKDKTGRVHFGFEYEFDFNTLEMTYHYIYPYVDNNDSRYICIINGKYGIYNIWGRTYAVFNEEEDRFNEEYLYLPEPSEGEDYYYFYDNFYNGLQNVDGRLISTYNNMTFEVIENPDATINVVRIDDFWDFNNMPFTIDYWCGITYYNGTWYYPSNSGDLYKLVDGEWINLGQVGVAAFTGYYYPHTSSYNGLLFGPVEYSGDYAQNPYIVNIGDESVKSTDWYETKNFAVDLDSNQTIGGYKTFKDQTNFDTIVATHIYSNYSRNNGGFKITSYNNIEFDVTNFVKLPKSTLVDGDYAASKSDTIQNKELVYPGKINKEVANICGESNWNYSVVFNNKLYHNSYNHLVFDGENVVVKDNWYPFEYTEITYYAKITSNRFFFVNGSNIYELVGDEWVLRTDQNNYDRSWIFPYEDTLVEYSEGKKLNTTTWEWEDWLNKGVGGFGSAHRISEYNGVTYQFDDYNLQIFNPETGDFEYYMNWTDSQTGAQYWSNGNRFFHNGNIYLNANNTWWIVDLETKTLIYQDIKTDSEYIGVYSLNGKTYTFSNHCTIDLMYEAKYTKPELPTDGKYNLTGQVVDGKTIYSWEKGGEGGGVTIEEVDAEIDNKLAGYATEQYVQDQGYITSQEVDAKLSGYITYNEIPDPSNLATKDEIPSLEGYATESWVESKIDEIDVITLEDVDAEIDNKLGGYATESWVEGKGYATLSDVMSQGYVTELEVDTKLSGYITYNEIPDPSNLATKDEIPSLEGYATESWVEGKGYLTEHQSLVNYLDKTFTGVNTLAGTIQVGSATTNLKNAFNHIRNVGSSSLTGKSVNGACFSVNTDGTAAFSHKIYDDNGSNAKNDAVLRFSGNGIQFAKKPGGAVIIPESDYKDVAMKEDIPSVWTGTQAEWDALTTEQKASYTIALVR